MVYLDCKVRRVNPELFRCLPVHLDSREKRASLGTLGDQVSQALKVQ
jgi:hypothetical protein